MMKRPIERVVPTLLLFAFLAIPMFAQDGPPEGGPPSGGARGGMMGGGRGVRGTVTAISGTTLTIKTDEGDTYKIFTSENSHLMKERQPVKIADIKVGDMLVAAGEVDAKAKTVGAVFVAVLDAEQVKQAKQLREQLGKSWTAGEVTAIKDLSITIKRVDDVSQTFTVDENTSFTKRKESITLGDIQVGDRLSAKGGLKDGTFVATSVTVGRMGMWPGGEGRGPGGAHGPGPSGTPPNQ